LYVKLVNLTVFGTNELLFSGSTGSKKRSYPFVLMYVSTDFIKLASF